MVTEHRETERKYEAGSAPFALPPFDGLPGVASVSDVRQDTLEQAGADGPITVYESASAPAVCYTECYRGGRLVDDPGEVADMTMTLNMIRAAALSPRDSLELMRRIRREIHD